MDEASEAVAPLPVPAAGLPENKQAYQCYLVISNPIGQKTNLGNLIRCAAAFAVQEIIVVGARRWSTHGAHGSHKHMNYRCFDDWTSAAAFLALEKKCDLCGIVPPPSAATTPTADLSTSVLPIAAVSDESTAELTAVKNATPRRQENEERGNDPRFHSSGTVPVPFPVAVPVISCAEDTKGTVMKYADTVENDCCSSGKFCRRRGAGNRSTAVRRRPFRRSTAFLVGHRNRLEGPALEVCDFLVHVDQQRVNGAPVMEVDAPVTTSIALHHFTAWAQYPERRYTGEKFDVETDLPRYRPPEEGKVSEEKRALARERERLRQERLAADPLEAGAGGSEEDAWGDAGLGWLSMPTGDYVATSDGGDY